jgi:hypothetical protein
MALLIWMSHDVLAQNAGINSYLSLKPSEIKAEDSEIKKYEVILKWQNLDAIEGTQFNCNAVKAIYLVEPGNDSVSWKQVSLAQVKDFRQQDFTGTSLPAFDYFRYKINETNFLKEDFYEPIPPDQRDLAKWLVSDAIQMQGLAWYVFDSLKFNIPFVPKFMDNYDVKFEDWVTFTSRYQQLIWSGITQYNQEVCAIVKFESLYNPLKIDNDQMSVKGRSLYYGELWISLKDKQVEYATMFEDVIMKLRNSSSPQEQWIDLQREIVFKKVKNN